MSVQTLGSLDDSYFEIDDLSTWCCLGWSLVLGGGVSWFGFFFSLKSTCIQLRIWFATGYKCAFNGCSPGQHRLHALYGYTVLCVTVFVIYISGWHCAVC